MVMVHHEWLLSGHLEVQKPPFGAGLPIKTGDFLNSQVSLPECKLSHAGQACAWLRFVAALSWSWAGASALTVRNGWMDHFSFFFFGC